MIRIHSLARVLPLLAVALFTSACRDDKKESPVGPVETETPEASVGSVAYLTISDSAPEAGSTVTVTAHANGTNLSVGSFAARLAYSPDAFSYVAEASTGAGMRAVNPQVGDISVAGVNVAGFAEGELFAVQFKVIDPNAISSLALTVSELTAVNYRNEKASLSVQKPIRLARARQPISQ